MLFVNLNIFLSNRGLTAQELADFMDRVLISNERMMPHMRTYRNYLRNEETYAADSQVDLFILYILR